jgi:hypothetical protein
MDAESIAEAKTRIASRSSTAVIVREKIVEVAPPALPLSPPTSGHHVRDPSSSPPLENKDEEGKQCPPPRSQWHYVPEYLVDNRPGLEVRKMR